MNPVPHIAARQMANADVAAGLLAGLRDAAGVHLFPFGGFTHSAQWIDNVAAGPFRLTEPEESFSLQTNNYANRQETIHGATHHTTVSRGSRRQLSPPEGTA